jgi:hypothetical protein
LSDPARDRDERRVWQPRAESAPADPDALPPIDNVADERTEAEQQSATVRLLNPAHDVAGYTLWQELVALADRALDNQLAAEQLVAGLCRMQAGLVTTATQSAAPAQRAAAKAELERLVRRAALDALPPVVRTPPAGGAPVPAAAPADPKKTAPMRRPATASAEPPAAEVERRPIVAPRGTATASRKQRPASGRRLGLAVLAMILAVGGLGVGYLASASDDGAVLGPIADLMDRFVTPAAQEPVAEAPPEPQPEPEVEAEPPTVASPEPPSADELQITATEPPAVPLLRLQRTNVEPPPADTLEGFPGSGLSIYLLYQGGSAAAARANELSGSLALAKDPPLVELRSVDYTIATPRIRYYYADDADAADALAGLLEPPANGADSWEIQNFTFFRPLPPNGRLEVFIPSAGG